MRVARAAGVCVLAALIAPSPVLAVAAGERLSASELRREGNAICRTTSEAIERLAGRKTSFTRGEMMRWMALLRQQEAKLARLVPPAAGTRLFQTMLASGRSLPSLVLAFDAAERRGDFRLSRRLMQRADALADERTRIARRLGLTVCAEQ